MCRLARFDNQTKLGNSRHDDLAPDAKSLTVIGSVKFIEPFAGLGERVVAMAVAHSVGAGPKFPVRH